MGMQQRLAFGLAVSGVALLAAVFPGRAAAQYGGQPVRNLFSAPADARRPAMQAEDPYNPDVWIAQRGTRAGSAASAGRRSTATSRLASHQPEVVPAPIAAGDVAYEIGPEIHGGAPCESCGHGDCTGESCDVQCVPCRRTGIDHVQLFLGPHGFKGPRDGGTNGNFGFQEGFNLSGPFGMAPCHDWGYQFGFLTTQSNLSGTQQSGDSREQFFLTAGIFSRQEVGLQWGVVWDWYHDDYMLNGTADEIELSQVRAQISMRNIHGDEVGFWTAVGTDESESNGITWTAQDQYLLFYKWQFDLGAEFRFYGGLSGDADGIVGSNFWVPLNDHFSLGADWAYLIPEESSGPFGAAQEQWNVSFNLIWHWHCEGRTVGCSPYRPMFNVANNGLLFLQQDP